jgi:hypothetical protein
MDPVQGLNLKHWSISGLELEIPQHVLLPHCERPGFTPIQNGQNYCMRLNIRQRPEDLS